MSAPLHAPARRCTSGAASIAVPIGPSWATSFRQADALVAGLPSKAPCHLLGRKPFPGSAKARGDRETEETPIPRSPCAKVAPMSAPPTGFQDELRIEVNRLVVRRTRVALCIGLATVTAFAASNHVGSQPPPWTDVMNLSTAVLI